MITFFSHYFLFLLWFWGKHFQCRGLTGCPRCLQLFSLFINASIHATKIVIDVKIHIILGFWAFNSSKTIGLKKSVSLLQTLWSCEYHHCTAGYVVWSKIFVCLKLSTPWRCFKRFEPCFHSCSGFDGCKCRGIIEAQPEMALSKDSSLSDHSRLSSVNVQISLLHCLKHCTLPPNLSLCAECWEEPVPKLSVLTIAELAGARCCMTLRDAAVLALHIAKPWALGNLFCVSRAPSVLEPGLQFSHKQQQQCQSLPPLEYD